MKKKIALGISLITILLIIIFLDRIISFSINIKWFNEVGYLSVYFTKITAILKLMVPMFIISFTAIWLYYRSLRANIAKWNRVVDVRKGKGSIERKIFIYTNLIISLVISYLFAATYWYRILQFTNAAKFNEKDPIFNLDISFYIFKLPLIQGLYSTFMSLLILLVIITFVTYFAMNIKDKMFMGDSRAFFLDIRKLRTGITKFAGKQLAIVSSLILLCMSLGYMIKAWNLVYSPRGVVFGASYTDVNITLNFYKVIIVLAIVAAFVIFVSVIMSKIKPIVLSLIVIVLLVFGEQATGALIEQFIVKPNARTYEQQYIKYNIESTRKAFNINNIEEKAFEAKNSLTKESLNNNRDIIDNIKINAFRPVSEFYNQVQVIRPYYDFYDIDVDRYIINGKYSQVFLSPREITLQALQQNTWQNKHLTYTHGYGIVMSKVNSVTTEGQPDFIIKDIPPNNNTDLKIDNPRIYFGEKKTDYSIVNTGISEVDYPEGSSNKSNKYNGKAGINMSFINKVLFMINKKDVNFMLSKDINSDSKIIINSNIVERVKKIAPFLTYDKDPYIVISEGKLFWIMDAYTTSDRYPYSTPYEGINYIRNSVKVVIDAFDGTTDFYIVDKNDPIAQSYSKIFPDLFKDVSSLSKDLASHFKYPEDLFNMQCKVLNKYHVVDSGVFYSSEDQWEISKNQKELDGETLVNDPTYMVMKFPEAQKEEMVLVNYFTMKDKDNMVSLLGARMDGDNYGKIVLYKFPTQKTVYSPYQFLQRLKQDTSASKELSLWNKEGSAVQFGDTTILPINDSLLYVRPVYLRATGKNSIPEMKRVAVSYGDRIVLAENINAALNDIFNIQPSKPETPGNEEPVSEVDKEKLKEASDYYDKAMEAQKSGDWAKYGEYIKKLGEILSSLKK